MLYCASRGRHTYPKRLWQSSVCASDLDYIALSMGEVAPATAGFQPWIRLVSPTGVLLGNGIGTSAVQIAATAPTSGTYTVIRSEERRVGKDCRYESGSYLHKHSTGHGTVATATVEHGGHVPH